MEFVFVTPEYVNVVCDFASHKRDLMLYLKLVKYAPVSYLARQIYYKFISNTNTKKIKKYYIFEVGNEIDVCLYGFLNRIIDIYLKGNDLTIETHHRMYYDFDITQATLYDGDTGDTAGVNVLYFNIDEIKRINKVFINVEIILCVIPKDIRWVIYKLIW